MYSIAIDGPSGAGKSTLAKALAKELSFLYVDTGAIYRTVGLFAKKNDIDPKDENALSAKFPDIKINLVWKDGTQHVILNDEDVSDLIRTPEMSMYASAVSAFPKVRAFLLDMQRNFSKENNVIMDGRDIGTVVLPDADVKLFLVANSENRAKRRYKELLEKGQNVSYEEVLSDMIQRDKNDSERQTAPCVAAPDAILFDNSALTLEETIVKALEIIHGKINETV